MSDSNTTPTPPADDLDGKTGSTPGTPAPGDATGTPPVEHPDAGSGDAKPQDTDGPQTGSGGTEVHADDPNAANGRTDDMFPREYVEKLRKSEAKYRDRAKQSDDLARRLHTALVRLDGRLADPDDLPFDEKFLDDPDALAAAVTDLITRKPGLKAQKFGSADVGAGKRGSDPKPPMDLISLIKNRT